MQLAALIYLKKAAEKMIGSWLNIGNHLSMINIKRNLKM